MVVRGGGRPTAPPVSSEDIMPQYKDVMKQCWQEVPGSRPTFKQVLAQAKCLFFA